MVIVYYILCLNDHIIQLSVRKEYNDTQLQIMSILEDFLMRLNNN